MTTRRRVRVVLNYDVEIREISMEAFQQRKAEWQEEQQARGLPALLPRTVPSEHDLQDLRALQEALRANPEALDAWLRFEVLGELDSFGFELPSPVEEETAQREILMPVVETLPPEPREKFRAALARGDFWELADELYHSFVLRVSGYQIEPLDEYPGPVLV